MSTSTVFPQRLHAPSSLDLRQASLLRSVIRSRGNQNRRLTPCNPPTHCPLGHADPATRERPEATDSLLQANVQSHQFRNSTSPRNRRYEAAVDSKPSVEQSPRSITLVLVVMDIASSSSSISTVLKEREYEPPSFGRGFERCHRLRLLE
ncbi:hypothetical protein VTO42DRAFT_7031 [Malbranchea cinnamomea]